MCIWKRFWSSSRDADIGRSRNILSERPNASFMSAYYDRALRTDSYNDIATKISILVSRYAERISKTGSQSFIHADDLLQPPRETVDAFLQEGTTHESPDMMKMTADFFQISCMACTLCIAILQSTIETRDQCVRMDATLAGIPRSGEVLGVANLQLMLQGFAEIFAAENAFSRVEMFDMLKNVHNRFLLLNSEVENRKKEVQRKEKSLRSWKGGCIGMAVALLAGATVVAVLVKAHVMMVVVAAPIMMTLAAVARDQFQQKKGPLDNHTEPTGKVLEKRENGAISQGNASCMLEKGGCHMSHAETAMNLEESEILSKSVGLYGNTREEKLKSTLTVPANMQSIVSEADDTGEDQSATHGHKNVVLKGFGIPSACDDEVRQKTKFVGVARGVQSNRRVDYLVKIQSAMKKEYQCWGMKILAKQSSELDTLENGSFLVSRMLDTLGCLVTGLQETVDSNKRLLEFGLVHQRDTACMLQVGKQLFRIQSPLVGQLAKLEEQVVFGFYLINKARVHVFQKFCSTA